jgi:hypothetical protein
VGIQMLLTTKRLMLSFDKSKYHANLAWVENDVKESGN